MPTSFPDWAACSLSGSNRGPASASSRERLCGRGWGPLSPGLPRPSPGLPGAAPLRARPGPTRRSSTTELPGPLNNFTGLGRRTSTWMLALSQCRPPLCGSLGDRARADRASCSFSTCSVPFCPAIIVFHCRRSARRRGANYPGRCWPRRFGDLDEAGESPLRRRRQPPTKRIAGSDVAWPRTRLEWARDASIIPAADPGDARAGARETPRPGPSPPARERGPLPTSSVATVQLLTWMQTVVGAMSGHWIRGRTLYCPRPPARKSADNRTSPEVSRGRGGLIGQTLSGDERPGSSWTAP